MKMEFYCAAAAMALSMLAAPAAAEILAIMNYESKPEGDLRSLKLSGDMPRREGLAIVDVDPDMSDGSVSVVDLESGEVIASMDTLKNAGFNPNSLTLLPEWNHLAGH